MSSIIFNKLFIFSFCSIDKLYRRRQKASKPGKQAGYGAKNMGWTNSGPVCYTKHNHRYIGGANSLLKHYFKVCFKMTFAHLTVQVFSLALGPLIFYVILGTQLGWYVMSAVLSVAYAMWIYSTAYKIADKDIKSYSAHKPYLAKGLVLPIPTLLITFVLTLLYDFSFYHTFADYNTRMWVELIVRNLFYGWNFAFEGFRSAADGTVSLLYWVLCFGMMPVFSFLGYWAGMNRYEFGYQFFSRLVYKDEKKEK